MTNVRACKTKVGTFCCVVILDKIDIVDIAYDTLLQIFIKFSTGLKFLD